MTSYHGGKQSTGYDIATCILNDITKDGGGSFQYLEPFCGMLGVFRHMAPYAERSVACDINECVIEMWKRVQQGWLPPARFYNEQAYESLRRSKRRDNLHIKGFIGHHYSFGGIFFGSYRFKYANPVNLRGVIQRIKDIKESTVGTTFLTCSYKDLALGKVDPGRKFVIYCDPPYRNSACKYSESFDTAEFLDWCEQMTLDGNVVYVSEYKISRKTFKKIAKIGQCTGGYRGFESKPQFLFKCCA